MYLKTTLIFVFEVNRTAQIVLRFRETQVSSVRVAHLKDAAIVALKICCEN